MTRHDFIFSGQPRHRILRHAAFWIAWCLTYLLLFHYPIYSFKGWSLTHGANSLSNIQKLGLAGFVLKTMFFNVLLSVVVPQAIFNYGLLYYLLPNYFYKKRNRVITAGVVIAALLMYFLLAIHAKYFTGIANYFLGIWKTWPPYLAQLKDDSHSVIRELLTGFPIVTGFALTIKLMKRWWLKQKETEQLADEKTKAELQLLKAQIHPHFLFNTLNNIYYFTLSASPKAPEMIRKLSALLHYILNECNQPLVPLEKEINLIRDYMALEKIRYGEQMIMDIDLQENYTGKRVAPLLLIPFVENSFKHGTSKMIEHPWVRLRITVEDGTLHFFIINSRPQEAEPGVKKGNIGLKNVKKRLQLLYPGAHELTIVPEAESFAVYLKIQLQGTHLPAASNEELKTTAAYAMA